jgi:hypothetical protein
MAGVLAQHLKQWLAFAEGSLEASVRERYWTTMPRDLERSIRDAAPLTFLPVGHSVRMSEHTLAALGPRRAHQFHTDSFTRILRTPRFGPMLRTGVRLLGLSPASFARWADKGWSAMFRDCGVVRGESVAAKCARIRFDGMPAEVLRSGPWVQSCASGAEGILVFCRASGVVRLLREEHGFVIELEWS